MHWCICLALQRVIRSTGIVKRGTVYHISVQILAYADDVNLISRTVRDLKEAFIKLNNKTQKMDLKLNESNT